MPARKVSLGVPLYGVRWTATAAPEKADFVQDNEGPKQKRWKTASASWPKIVPELLKANQPIWDDTEQAHRLELTDNGAKSVVWYEDAQSLAPKLKLATGRWLGWGISCWVLGQEDPEFWTLLAREYRVNHPATPRVSGTPEKRAFAAARRMHMDEAAIVGKTAKGK
jgi:spore germination protein YaaH